MRRALGVLLIVFGVLANNLVYVNDLLLGESQITLHGWRSYAGLLVSVAIILVGTVLLARSRTAG
jgi:hypothetical protein